MTKPIDAPKGNIRSLRQIFVYLAPYKLSLAGVCFALIFTSTAVLALGQGLAFLVDKGFREGNTALLDTALILLLVITAVLALATYARFYLITYTGERVIADIRRDLYRHLLYLSPAFFETERRGDILSRLTTDTTLLQVVVGSSLSVALRNILLFIGGVSLLIYTSPKLTLFVAGVLPIVIVPILWLGKKVRRYALLTQEKVAELSIHTEESVNGIQTIQSFVREAEEEKHFQVKVQESVSVSLQRIRYRALLTALVILLIFSAIGFVLCAGGRDVLAGVMTPGELSSFLFYSLVVAGSTGALSEVAGDLQRAAGATERLFELLNTTSAIQNPEQPVPLADDFAGDITFRNVSFSYPSRPEFRALDDILLTIEPGALIALVGPSGAGKTTILQLLQRFYDPQGGSIFLGKQDIRDLSIAELRSQFGLVPQDPVIFSTTIAENIAYGNATADRAAIEAAAKAAAAYDFIQELPDQFDTFVGEKGVRLSGGQKQRIAIARAILKDPKILLLDEATSALDAENETLVQHALERLMQGRTTIVIAHRLATVLKADKIVVLDRGTIDAMGTHTELLDSSPLYKRLAELQLV